MSSLAVLVLTVVFSVVLFLLVSFLLYIMIFSDRPNYRTQELFNQLMDVNSDYTFNLYLTCKYIILQRKNANLDALERMYDSGKLESDYRDLLTETELEDNYLLFARLYRNYTNTREILLNKINTLRKFRNLRS